MESKIESKVPFYEIANKFFIGAIFIIAFLVITLEKLSVMDFYVKHETILKDWGVLVSAVLLLVSYEIGFIINRASSILVAPLLAKTKIWPIDSYGIDVSEIKKTNETFNAMITENVFTRSQILTCLILLIVALICQKWWFAIALLFLIVVFTLAGRKHCIRINIIRKAEFDRKEKTKKETIDRKKYLGIENGELK